MSVPNKTNKGMDSERRIDLPYSEEEIMAKVSYVVGYGLKLQTAENICQEVFIKYWLARNSGKPIAHHPQYLSKIIRNTIKSMFRRVQAKIDSGQPRIDLQNDSQFFTSHLSDVSEIVEEIEILPDVEKLAIKDRLLVGRSFEQIAEIHGGHPRTWRERYNRGIDRVCSRLGLPENHKKKTKKIDSEERSRI